MPTAVILSTFDLFLQTEAAELKRSITLAFVWQLVRARGNAPSDHDGRRRLRCGKSPAASRARDPCACSSFRSARRSVRSAPPTSRTSSSNDEMWDLFDAIYPDLAAACSSKTLFARKPFWVVAPHARTCVCVCGYHQEMKIAVET